MNTPDWNEAPHKATHYGPQTDWNKGWYYLDTGQQRWYYMPYDQSESWHEVCNVGDPDSADEVWLEDRLPELIPIPVEEPAMPQVMNYQATEPDWSKAPAEATHFGPHTQMAHKDDKWNASWYVIKDGEHVKHSPAGNPTNWASHASTRPIDELIPRPSAAENDVENW